jgi:peptidoglycan/LPS O-acetylase OafA/YrhL
MSSPTLAFPAAGLRTTTVEAVAPAPPKEPRRYAFLDALRGLGALGVAIYHIDRWGELSDAADTIIPAPLLAIIWRGWAAVPVFFVMAGFVAAQSLRDARITGRFAGSFALRRLLRLGGPYWVVVLLVVALGLATRGIGSDTPLNELATWWHPLAQMTFLQDALRLGNLSAGMWFVAIDLQWGLVFVLLMMGSQGLARALRRVPWADAIARLAFLLPPALAALFVFNLDMEHDAGLHYYFHMPALGVLAFWALDRRIHPAVFWTYCAALVVGLFLSYRLNVHIATVAGVTLYVGGQKGWLQNFLNFGPLQYLGRISYSLFLIHYPVSWLILELGTRLTGAAPVAALLWMLLALLASIAAADLLYRLAEEPSLRLARKLKAT